MTDQSPGSSWPNAPLGRAVLSSSDPGSCLEMERCGEDASMSLSPWHLLLLPTHCPLDRCSPLIGSHTSACTSCTNKHRSENICQSENDELEERVPHTASEVAWRTPPCCRLCNFQPTGWESRSSHSCIWTMTLTCQGTLALTSSRYPECGECRNHVLNGRG